MQTDGDPSTSKICNFCLLSNKNRAQHFVGWGYLKLTMNKKPTFTIGRVAFENVIRIYYALSVFEKKNPEVFIKKNV